MELIGICIAFCACIISIIILQRREDKKEKTRKTSDILFNASVQEKQHTAKEVFETLSEAGIELNFLGNQSDT